MPHMFSFFAAITITESKMILLLKEEDNDNDSNATLPDAKMICDR
jgi:hypothetical protein